MAKAPAFQFYANDFMDATRLWEANAVGMYVRCLCIQWTHGSIPADLRMLARAIHCERTELEQCWPIMASKFLDQGDGTLKNSRLEVVRERQFQVSQRRSEAGKAGAIAKANGQANALANGSTKAKQRKEKVEGEVLPISEKERASGSKVLFANCKFAVLDVAKQHLPELVAEGVNILHYLESIRNWSDQKDEKRNDRGWLATFRQWTKTDREKGQLRMLVKQETIWNPRA